MEETFENIAVDGVTVPQAYLRRVKLSPNRAAMSAKRNGSYESLSWGEFHEQVLGLFEHFKGWNLDKGDRICILSSTRPEWVITDIAIQCSGLVTVPIYQSSHTDDVAYVIEHSGAKAIFAEDESQLEKLDFAFKETGKKLPIVVYEKSRGLPYFGDLKKKPEKADFEASVAAIESTHIASLVYTSGTTGRPKGVILTQNNFVEELRHVAKEFQFRNDDSLLTFLPFAHILGRVESLMPIFSGLTMNLAESINTVGQNIVEVKPTILVSVPRIYEKVYAKILAGVEAGTPIKKKIFRWALEIGREVARIRSEKKAVPLPLFLKYKAADRLVFSKVREKLGGRIRVTISGGAPLAAELCEFFHACGIPIMEGYGLTETTGAVSVNVPNDYSFGTVGRPFAATEFKIAEDGEILVRGPVVFSGYFKNKEATDEAVTKDGWFRTGDIGEFNSRGMLRITDRKKELIVTSAGKNIAPQKLENLLKQIPLVSNAMVYGDKQKYLVALLAPNEEAIKRWAKEESVTGKVEELAQHPKLVSILEKELKTINQSLATFETIKKFRMLPLDFTVETGELTPSMKIKRKVVIQKYGGVIEELYS